MIDQEDGWQNWTIFVQYGTSLMDGFALELPVGLVGILSDLYYGSMDSFSKSCFPLLSFHRCYKSVNFSTLNSISASAS